MGEAVCLGTTWMRVFVESRFAVIGWMLLTVAWTLQKMNVEKEQQKHGERRQAMEELDEKR